MALIIKSAVRNERNFFILAPHKERTLSKRGRMSDSQSDNQPAEQLYLLNRLPCFHVTPSF